MEFDREVLNEIVSEQAEIIKSKALEQIKRIQEDSENSLDRIVSDLMNQIENFPAFNLWGGIEILRNGGIIKTCEYESQWDNANWSFTLGGQDIFYEDHPQRRLSKGRYRVTLIMEKLPEE